VPPINSTDEPQRRRVLVAVNGRIGEKMAAPEVRGWEMARALARRHDVTVALPDGDGEIRDGVRFADGRRRNLVAEARRADVVIAPRVPPYLFAALADSSALMVADLYNPFDLEHAELMGRASIRRELEAARVAHRLQLRFADVILCAVEAQRRRLATELEHVTRHRHRPPLLVVPFGIGDDPPPSTRRPLREHFPQIGPSDPVVLWWGQIWRWFDAETAIRAVGRLAEQRPDLRLVFTVGPPPRGSWPELESAGAAMKLAERLGLLGRNVLFLEEWVDQSLRHQYLAEADVGLTLARETPEKEQAARGRYMDYLWASLPCVLGAGDELADRFAREGFALTAEPGDLEGATRALAALIDDPGRREAARAARESLARSFRWPVAVEPLVEAIDGLAGKRPERSGALASVLGELRGYYARRLAHKATLAVARERPA
jgi:glycosyltransferase involved in cell wall biosynthesis